MSDIGTKACPGLRSGMDGSRHDRWSRHAGVRWNPLALVIAMKIDRSSSLSLVIRDIPWSFRPLNSSFRRRPESRGVGTGGCSAGACPQLGAGCVAQTTPDPPINQCIQFSYLGVPAPACMGDWYENRSFSSRQRTVAKPVARGLVPRVVPTTPSTIPCRGAPCGPGWGSHPPPGVDSRMREM